MKILLIKPPQETNEVQPPLGLGYLASSVEKIAKVKIIDSIKEKYSIVDLLKVIKKESFDLIGIQCYTIDFNIVKTLVEEIKKWNSKQIVVLGGPHPTLAPEETLQKIKANYVFLGEAEISFQKFVNLFKKDLLNYINLKKIPGIAYFENKKIIVNKSELPEILDKFHPSWNLFDLKNYPNAPHGAFCKQSPVAPLIITRGCPFNCTYCGGPKISGRRIRTHSLNFILNQIDLLVKKYNIKEIHIEDDNFTINHNFVEQFCKELIKRKYCLTWTCPNGVRIDTLDEPLIQLMKQSGMYSVSVGIESGSDKIRTLMRKNLSTKTIKEKMELLKKSGISDLIGFFILGYPGETTEDMEKTINFSLKLPLTRATFSAFKPFPGTDIYYELLQKKEIEKIDYSNFSLDKVAWSPKGISERKLKNLRRKAFLLFYSRPKIIFRLIKNIKSFENLKFILVRIYRWILR